MLRIDRRVRRTSQGRWPGLLFLAFSILLLVSLVLASCARTDQRTPLSPAERDASLRRIAADYARDADLAKAQASLDKLGLANPTQLLVTLAEQSVNESRPAAEIIPLARLTEALGAHSPRLITYLAPTATAVPPSPTPAPPSPTASPTAAPLPFTATPTTIPPTVAPTASPSPTPRPHVVAASAANLRGGPGVNYPLVGELRAGQEVNIIGRTAGSDWWQVAVEGAGQAWVAGTVVKVQGPIDPVPVAKDIPVPPATFTPAPPTATPKPAGPEFRFVSKRLWGVEENGGFFDGPSVHCGEKRQLRVLVIDAAGNPLNGVTVKVAYGNQEEDVTGSKGPGLAEFILGGGQDAFIVRDVDGHQPSSDYARGMSTDPAVIPTAILMGSGFCKNAEDCAHFVGQGGCRGHYSWDVVFQRAY